MDAVFEVLLGWLPIWASRLLAMGVVSFLVKSFVRRGRSPASEVLRRIYYAVYHKSWSIDVSLDGLAMASQGYHTQEFLDSVPEGRDPFEIYLERQSEEVESVRDFQGIEENLDQLWSIMQNTILEVPLAGLDRLDPCKRRLRRHYEAFRAVALKVRSREHLGCLGMFVFEARMQLNGSISYDQAGKPRDFRQEATWVLPDPSLTRNLLVEFREAEENLRFSLEAFQKIPTSYYMFMHLVADWLLEKQAAAINLLLREEGARELEWAAPDYGRWNRLGLVFVDFLPDQEKRKDHAARIASGLGNLKIFLRFYLRMKRGKASELLRETFLSPCQPRAYVWFGSVFLGMALALGVWVYLLPSIG